MHAHTLRRQKIQLPGRPVGWKFDDRSGRSRSRSGSAQSSLDLNGAKERFPSLRTSFVETRGTIVRFRKRKNAGESRGRGNLYGKVSARKIQRETRLRLMKVKLTAARRKSQGEDVSAETLAAGRARIALVLEEIKPLRHTTIPRLHRPLSGSPFSLVSFPETQQRIFRCRTRLASHATCSPPSRPAIAIGIESSPLVFAERVCERASCGNSA